MELGSNFELDISSLTEQQDTVFEYLGELNSIYTDSGRSALKLLNKLIPKGKILLPVYICESIIQTFNKEFDVQFYQINEDLSVDIEDIEQKLDDTVVAVYLLHYFGKIQNGSTLSYLQKKKELQDFIIIEDTTHSLLTSKITIGDYCICSLRKWFAIPDGGVLYSRRKLLVGHESDLRNKGISQVLGAMILKYFSIKNNVLCNQIYRSIFVEEEERLDRQEEVLGISDISRALLKCYSLNEVSQKRLANFQLLKNELRPYNISPIYDESDFIPFTFPIFVSDRDKFRQLLNQKNIYCAVHWPIKNETLKKNKVVSGIAKDIISLPMDQRYAEEHIEYLIKSVLECKNGENNV